ncbi:MAG: cation:dicarboxylase symporter family transporter [Pseudomonadota bacterium]
MLNRVPAYVWTLLSLLAGLALGGLAGDHLAGVASGTQSALSLFIRVVPVLIFIALSPAVHKITQQGRGGRLALTVVCWYLLTSICAGLLGVVISSLLFDIEMSAREGDLLAQAGAMLSLLNSDASASWPLLAIAAAVLAGLLANRVPMLATLLTQFDQGLSRSTPLLGRVMPVLVFFLGITLGVNIGATESLSYYVLMTLYTLLLCAAWLGLYLLVVIKLLARQPVGRVLRDYYFPTALFAAGTCSSLATLPVNLDNARRYGADPAVSNFVIPIGCVINMDTSALAYVAYAPFVMTVVFDLPVTWAVLLVAWPAIVLFTIAAPGLPAGMGTALWSSTLFSALLGLEGDEQAMFIGTWIALSGGIPDMLRTATNATCDGFTAIFLSALGRHREGPVR